MTIASLTDLREVADDMRAVFIDLAENVEEKRLDVEVERLVVEEQLGEETEILTVDFVLPAVDFPDAESALAVDLFSKRLSVRAFALRKMAIS